MADICPAIGGRRRAPGRDGFDRDGGHAAIGEYMARLRKLLGQAYFVVMIGVELALVILAGPAATAGAICVDRARGTLAHMLMTDLSTSRSCSVPARLLPVFGLVACTWPVMAISSLLGRVDPIAALAGICNYRGRVAVLGCTIALAFSAPGPESHTR